MKDPGFKADMFRFVDVSAGFTMRASNASTSHFAGGGSSTKRGTSASPIAKVPSHVTVWTWTLRLSALPNL